MLAPAREPASPPRSGRRAARAGSQLKLHPSPSHMRAAPAPRSTHIDRMEAARAARSISRAGTRPGSSMYKEGPPPSKRSRHGASFVGLAWHASTLTPSDGQCTSSNRTRASPTCARGARRRRAMGGALRRRSRCKYAPTERGHGTLGPAASAQLPLRGSTVKTHALEYARRCAGERVCASAPPPPSAPARGLNLTTAYNSGRTNGHGATGATAATSLVSNSPFHTSLLPPKLPSRRLPPSLHTLHAVP